MRIGRLTPAEQLQSVSMRYALPHVWRDVRPQARLPLAAVVDAPAEKTVVRSEQAREPALQRLEAVLFLTREPLNSRKLAQYANLADGTQARTLIRRLNQLYDAGGRAFRVEEVAGGFQLLTRRKFAAWLRRLEHVPPETRLSAPALETLAVIAYRQPVPRADIEAIRGVNCGEILRQLMERDLVRIGGRSEELGRPYLYTTTKRFLQVFGLVSLEDLPRATAIRSLPLTAPSPAGEAPPATEANGGENAPQQMSDPATTADPTEIEYTRDQA
jgi:segregation and condensation protein B